jgi:endo-1,4-beta-mannosidase
MGLNWLSQFKDACADATIDATNIHFYDDYDSDVINRFKTQVEKAAEIYGQKVWVTEFGLNTGTATEEQAASFLKDAMDYLDGSDHVQGYSWFMVGSGEYQLNSGDGLSAIGQVYASS